MQTHSTGCSSTRKVHAKRHILFSNKFFVPPLTGFCTVFLFSTTSSIVAVVVVRRIDSFLCFSHQQSFLQFAVVRENNIIQGRTRGTPITTTSSRPFQFLQNGIPRSSKVVINTIAIGHDRTKGKEKQPSDKHPAHSLEEKLP